VSNNQSDLPDTAIVRLIVAGTLRLPFARPPVTAHGVCLLLFRLRHTECAYNYEDGQECPLLVEHFPDADVEILDRLIVPFGI
jgi:hypothetical protein